MFKTVLVHLRGTTGDPAVLAAGLVVARPFAAHLECLHIGANLGRLVSRAAVLEMGEDVGAIPAVLETLKKQSAELAQAAARAFAAFCDAEGLPRADDPPGPDTMTAGFRETLGDEVDQLIAQSRYHDLLVVKGGSEEAGGLHPGELGRLIANAGRPVLLAPRASPRAIRTIVIGWRDVSEAARAVSIAMPILEKAERIFVVSASQEDEPASNCDGVVRQLVWHGLAAEAHPVVPGARDAAHAVLEIARAAHADLLVMGAYGHNRFSENILGGFTQGVLEDASLPVLMFH
jgi:nucleotide-binding universal stress UspA family protein